MRYGNISPMSNITNMNSPRSKSYFYEEPQIYDPFGKAGAGAPVRDSNGKLMSYRSNNVQKFAHDANSADIRRRKRAAHEYMQQQQQELQENKYKRNITTKFDKDFGGRDMADIMYEGPTGKPRMDPRTGLPLGGPLKSSDITQQSSAAPKHYTSNANSKIYHDELTREAEERRRMRDMEKLEDRRREQQHAQASDSVWGRPGAGAPVDPFNRKVKLEEALHAPTKQDGRVHYTKAMDESLAQYNGNPNTPRKYVRKTIKSSCANNFEILPDDARLVQHKPLSRPFAEYDA